MSQECIIPATLVRVITRSRSGKKISILVLFVRLVTLLGSSRVLVFIFGGALTLERDKAASRIVVPKLSFSA